MRSLVYTLVYKIGKRTGMSHREIERVVERGIGGIGTRNRSGHKLESKGHDKDQIFIGRS